MFFHITLEVTHQTRFFFSCFFCWKETTFTIINHFCTKTKKFDYCQRLCQQTSLVCNLGMLLLWFQNSTSNDISIWVTLILKKKVHFQHHEIMDFPMFFCPTIHTQIQVFLWFSLTFLSKIFNFSLTFLNIIILSLYIAKNLKWNSGIISKIKHFVLWWSSKTRAIIFTLYFMTTQMILYIDCAPMDKYQLCS